LALAFGAKAPDLIEATLGPPHARAAIVALYECAHVRLQAAIDLATTVAARKVLSRSISVTRSEAMTVA
jgi:hypothetical protein